MSADLFATLRQFDPDLPLERAQTIPNNWYFDPAVYAAECRSVFGGTWQMVGRGEQVAEPGSFLTADIAGEPILVVRDQEGVLRAFFNVCRHRAARVVEQAEGKASKLRCRYHGWTYDLAGRLRGTPEFEGVADFCREANGMCAMAVETCGPFVWVHQRHGLPHDAAPPLLAEFLAPFTARSDDLRLARYRFMERRDYVLACNWKVFVDNFLDGGYHVNTVHPGLAGVLDYARYRTEIAGNTSVQISPLRAPDPKEANAAVGAVRSGDNAYYWWIFPNFMVNVYGTGMDTNLVLPLGPERCRVVMDFYFTQPNGPGAGRYVAESIAVSHQIQAEDIGICEEVQKGLASRSYRTGRFSVRREAAGLHFHRLLARTLRAGADRC
jgi:choline monooxygenase